MPWHSQIRLPSFEFTCKIHHKIQCRWTYKELTSLLKSLNTPSPTGNSTVSLAAIGGEYIAQHSMQQTHIPNTEIITHRKQFSSLLQEFGYTLLKECIKLIAHLHLCTSKPLQTHPWKIEGFLSSNRTSLFISLAIQLKGYLKADCDGISSPAMFIPLEHPGSREAR